MIDFLTFILAVHFHDPHGEISEEQKKMIYNEVDKSHKNTENRKTVKQCIKNVKRYGIKQLNDPKKGKGVVAEHDIPGDKPIGYYRGELHVFPREPPVEEFYSKYTIAVNYIPGLYLMIDYTPSNSKWDKHPANSAKINHQCEDPSTEYTRIGTKLVNKKKNGKTQIIEYGIPLLYSETKKVIPAGEEFTADYGSDFFGPEDTLNLPKDGKWKFSKCWCKYCNGKRNSFVDSVKVSDQPSSSDGECANPPIKKARKEQVSTPIAIPVMQDPIVVVKAQTVIVHAQTVVVHTSSVVAQTTDVKTRQESVFSRSVQSIYNRLGNWVCSGVSGMFKRRSGCTQTKHAPTVTAASTSNSACPVTPDTYKSISCGSEALPADHVSSQVDPVAASVGNVSERKPTKRTAPTCSSAISDWRKLSEEMRGSFIGDVPWERRELLLPVKRHQQKVLYMELKTHERNGIVTLDQSDNMNVGLYGITCVRVTANKRTEFDKGHFKPICLYKRFLNDPAFRVPYQRFYKMWQTAGFVETKYEDGSLEMKYDQKVFEKQKIQQAKRY